MVEGADQGPMASVVRRLARLDVGRLRFHDFPADHVADFAGVQCSADRSDRGFHFDLVDAAGRCDRVGLARRPDRAQDPADGLDRLVFAVQLHCQLFSGFLVSVPVSRTARHRHGSGMAVRRGAGDGAMAGPLARLYGRGAAGLVGIGALLSSAAYGLLYNSIGWRGLLMIGVLPALSIVYVRRFVKEPPVWVENRR